MDDESPSARPVLIDLACDYTPVGIDAYTGLMASIAWIATRSDAYVRAVRAYQGHHTADPERAAALWLHLNHDAAIYGGSASIARNELFLRARLGDISAVGRRRRGGFQDVPSLEWIDAQIIHVDGLDALSPAGSEFGLQGPIWFDVRFLTDRLLRLWPCNDRPEKISTSAQSNRWSEAAMTAAIVGYADKNGQDRDAAWRQHFKAIKAEHGWDNRNFRDHWSKALGSEGRPGRKAQSAQ